MTIRPERLARIFAIAIAVVAMFDPSFSADRPVARVVSLGGDRRQPDIAQRIERSLGDKYTLVRGGFAGADATILLSPRASDGLEIASPVVAITDGSTRVRMSEVEAPPIVPSGASVPIAVGAELLHDLDSAVVELRDGPMLIDRVSVARDSSKRIQQATLHHVPAANESRVLTVTARAANANNSRSSDTALLSIEARPMRWRVFVYDARASWMSTFVRRTLEADTRFEVSSRILTSRAVSTTAGATPASLADWRDLEPYDLVIVGAPDVLRAGDVAGLDDYLRRRGGSVLLLFDDRVSGPVTGLLGATQWRSVGTEDPRAVFTGMQQPDSTRQAVPTLLVSEFAHPTPMPTGATTLARAGASDSSAVVFQLPTGAGRLIVSSAFDAWRFRQSSQSKFESFWQSLAAAAAGASLARIELSATPEIALTGEEITVAVTDRETLLSTDDNAELALSAALVAGDREIPVRLLPTEIPGRLEGRMRVPESGRYQLRVRRNAATSVAESLVVHVVDRIPSRAVGSDAGVSAIATASGGAVIDASQLSALDALLEQLVPASRQRVDWHPMQSPWWILPFSLLLGAEWWLRRRGGRP